MLSKLKNHLINLPGWRTNRKIVVFESDDWGSIRMASKEAYSYFLKKGYPVDQCAYSRYDTIERNKDLELLGELLLSVKDVKGNPARFTINNVVANPDFTPIKESGYQKYYYEPFMATLKRYPGTDRVMDLYRKGINEHIFQPQFHGREHVNVNRWLGALQKKDERLFDAFGHEMFTLPDKKHSNGRRDYLDSFGQAYEKSFETEKKIIEEGIHLFRKIWDFKSDTFIAPCYIWPTKIDKTLSANGIKGIQGTHVQRVPKPGLDLQISKRYHHTGQRNKLGQRYLVRNVFFEPTAHGRNNAIEKAMNQITRSFRYKKPAIVSSHRVNYMGGLEEENRTQNLHLLSRLLKKIKQKFPDVEFMSSDELLKVMVN